MGVKATRDGRRGRVRKHLSNRFQLAVDSVATLTGRSDEESYMAGWSWGDPVVEPGGPAEVAERVIERLESEYSSKHLSDLRRSIIAAHRAQQEET
ncbi:MAG: virulence factor [Acidimicrobiia bacterium]|nr:virulence factor [Acidimicrobiia bacterium]